MHKHVLFYKQLSNLKEIDFEDNNDKTDDFFEDKKLLAEEDEDFL